MDLWGKKKRKKRNQLVKGVKYEANNPAGRWAAVGITEITTPVPTASASGTKEPWRRDSEGHEGTARDTKGQPAPLGTWEESLLPQKDPRAQISCNGWVFPWSKKPK